MEIAPEYKRDLVRELRQRQTRCEALLWQQLRARQIEGCKFRRQHPIGRYIADFYCEEARLVVEVDGAYHDLPDQRNNDAERQAYIIGRGLRLVRLLNEEIETDLFAVLRRIRAAVQENRTP